MLDDVYLSDCWGYCGYLIAMYDMARQGMQGKAMNAE